MIYFFNHFGLVGTFDFWSFLLSQVNQPLAQQIHVKYKSVIFCVIKIRNLQHWIFGSVKIIDIHHSCILRDNILIDRICHAFVAIEADSPVAAQKTRDQKSQPNKNGCKKK